MKVTLDLDQLLADGKITRAEYEKLGSLVIDGADSIDRQRLSKRIRFQVTTR